MSVTLSTLAAMAACTMFASAAFAQSVDASGETVIVVGLKAGPHKVLFELADPTHRVIDSQTLSFEVPEHMSTR